MKHLSLIFFTLFVISVHAQSDAQSKNWLWEISHEDFKGKSYLYGSVHLNDPKLFKFDDSLYYALYNCSQFANEIDFTSIDTLMTELIMKELGKQDKSGEASEGEGSGEETSSVVFKGMKFDGEPTILDVYLCATAQAMGLSIYGLEDTRTQMDILDGIGSGNDGESLFYDDLVDMYSKGNIEDLKKLMSMEEAELLQMSPRNKVQASSFYDLAKQDATFGVVGAAHLFGDGNVLELLESQNCTVRRVGTGKQDDRIKKAYERYKSKDWITVKSEKYPVSIQSKSKVDFLDLNGVGEISMNMELQLGLIYASAVVGNPEGRSLTSEMINAVGLEMFPDDKFEMAEQVDADGMTSYHFKSTSQENAYRALFKVARDVITVQIVFGISNASLQHENVEYFLNGAQSIDMPVANWAIEKSDLGSFEYLFPENSGDFIVSEIPHPEFPDRNNLIVAYKSVTDGSTGDQYLVKYNNHPHGVLMLEPYENLEIIIDELGKRLKIEPEGMEYFNSGNLLGADARGVTEAGETYFLRCVIRGANVYSVLQVSSTGQRNDEFFNSLKLLKNENAVSKRFEFPAANFSIRAQDSFLYYKTNEEGYDMHNYDFNDNNNGSSLSLEFTEFDKYAEFSFTDSTFSYSNMVDTNVVDRLVFYEQYSYEDTCPGYFLQFRNDSTFLQKSEFLVYCNNHEIGLQIFEPIDFMEEDYARNIVESIKIKLDENSVKSLTKSKLEIILNDLYAEDEVVFDKALAEFNGRDDYTDNHLDKMFDLLDSDLIDKDSSYNAKYDIITKLHDHEYDVVELELMDHYNNTKSVENRIRILESFIARSGDSSIENLIKLLEGSPKEQYVPQDVYEEFQDSLGLFKVYYERLKGLHDKGTVVVPFLNLVTGYTQIDTTYEHLQKDSLYYSNIMKGQIENYHLELAQDSSYSVATFIMDYLLDVDMGEIETNLYETIMSHEDVYGKYRVLYNLLDSGEAVPRILLDNVMVSDYYRYWTQVNYDENNLALPDVYNNQSDIAKIIMKKYIYDEHSFSCETCEVIDEYSAVESTVGKMILIKCASNEEGKFYVGVVGGFDADDKFNYDDDQSVYYQSLRTEMDLDFYKKDLLDYIKGRQE